MSLTKNSDPPVPLSSNLLKLMSIESMAYKIYWGALNFYDIQVEPRKAASTLIHTLYFLQIAIALCEMSIAALKVLP